MNTEKLAKVYLDNEPLDLEDAKPKVSAILFASGKSKGTSVQWLKSRSDSKGKTMQPEEVVDRTAEPTEAIYLTSGDAGKFGRSGQDRDIAEGETSPVPKGGSGHKTGRDSDEDSDRESGLGAGRNLGRDSDRESGQRSGQQPGQQSGRDSDKDSDRQSGQQPGQQSGRQSDKDSDRQSGQQPGRQAGQSRQDSAGQSGKQQGQFAQKDAAKQDPSRKKDPSGAKHSRDDNAASRRRN